MKPDQRLAFIPLALFLMVSAAAPAQPAGDQAALAQQVSTWMAEGYDALELWDYAQAEAIDQKLQAAADAGDEKLRAKAAYFHGRLKFYTADYAESLPALERYQELDRDNLHPEFLEFLAQTAGEDDEFVDFVESGKLERELHEVEEQRAVPKGEDHEP